MHSKEKGYITAINDMTDNLIKNSETEIIDGKIRLIITEDRIKIVAAQMKSHMPDLDTVNKEKVLDILYELKDMPNLNSGYVSDAIRKVRRL